MMNRLQIRFFVFLLIWTSLVEHETASAQSPFSIGGYYKNFTMVLDPPQIQGAPETLWNPVERGLVNNRLRLHLSTRMSDRVFFQAAYDVSPRIQDPDLFRDELMVLQFNPPDYRLDDLPFRLYPERPEDVRSFAIFQNLDRAFFTWSTEFADVYVGRQAIAWGSARVVNPTDIIAPFSFDELDTEDRRGVDAIRVRVPVGFMGEVDVGYVAGDQVQLDSSAVFVRGKYYVAQTDVSALGILFRNHALVGFNVARALGGAGVWLEAAAVFDNVRNSFQIEDNYAYTRLTVGTDYNFSNSFYGFVEYHFSGAGASRPQEYLEVFRRPSVADGSVYLFGSHYLIPGGRYQISPLLSLNTQLLWNLNDDSFFLTPQLEYNIAENIYLSGGMFLSVGPSPKLPESISFTPQIQLESEFGTFYDLFFTSFRVYF